MPFRYLPPGTAGGFMLTLPLKLFRKRAFGELFEDEEKLRQGIKNFWSSGGAVALMERVIFVFDSGYGWRRNNRSRCFGRCKESEYSSL
ncbi:hypothetical protein TNIN_163151 [Trichonephila inaurata madagascariensis]|uniref:Uncharacterized protein n=1 Tax=Trichonephila inaurata madagascariensis TaxID=2747483 RepID=A0A8X6IC44_9ARAC|nr:hypothetical protein TNIN_163151 [Trichonephila inaurata madagascariensis]